LRDDIRDETLAILKDEGTAVLLVTHEPEEAMRMADKIALMRDGRIVQMGAPYNIYNSPKDCDAAAFFSDVNVIKGIVKGAQVDTPFGAFLAPGHSDGTKVEIVIRPQHLKLDFDRQGKGPLPTETDGVPARGTIARARFMGNETLVEMVMEHDGTRSAVRAIAFGDKSDPFLDLSCFCCANGRSDRFKPRNTPEQFCVSGISHVPLGRIPDFVHFYG